MRILNGLIWQGKQHIFLQVDSVTVSISRKWYRKNLDQRHRVKRETTRRLNQITEVVAQENYSRFDK